MFTPDWTKAPRWANWWAMDSDFVSHWFKEKPAIDLGLWGPDLNEYKLDTYCGEEESGDLSEFYGYWDVEGIDGAIIAKEVYYVLLYVHSLRERPTPERLLGMTAQH
jgi:hypothetical protein